MPRTDIPDGITRDDVLGAIRDLSEGTVAHEFHDSERYDLVFEGKRFAPKAVLGVAAQRVAGRILRPSDFSGGESSKCFRVLRELGFSVELKEARSDSKAVSFEVGREYNRRSEIHGVYGGQERGGIATPKDYAAIFLFTADRGEAFGYEDHFREDGVFLYTGEGQQGDMEFKRGNLALRDSEKDGRSIYLFEEVRKGVVRFVGNCRYLGHHHEDRSDSEGSLRRAIVFELELVVERDSTTIHSETATTVAERSATLDQLREAAMSVAPASTEPKVRLANVHYRAEAVKRYVLKRSEGRCEGCKEEAPFKNRRGQPYLEPHHTTRRADGGPDSPSHVIALCPNCHRRVHSGNDGSAYNQILINTLRELEKHYSS